MIEMANTDAAGSSEPLETWFSPDKEHEERGGPQHYIADEPLLDAVRTAIFLGQPLLVTGEPGSGKTELADYIAWRLRLSRPTGRDAKGRTRYEYALRFDTKSETRARDLFYSIDLVERFHAAHVEKARGALDPLDFIRFHALGRALLYARAADELSKRLLAGQEHPGQPRQSVVLIDEIDKAPSDVPNDLLMEIENLRFFMPELDRMVSAPDAFRPIVVITSNTEKPLPEAFLRRCIYYHMPPLEPHQLIRIVSERTGIDQDARLLISATGVFGRVRELPLQKKPATAELLGFVRALRAMGCAVGDQVETWRGWQALALSTLLKNRDDQRLAKTAFVSGARR